jgi:hypothetical protein
MKITTLDFVSLTLFSTSTSFPPRLVWGLHGHYGLDIPLWRTRTYLNYHLIVSQVTSGNIDPEFCNLRPICGSAMVAFSDETRTIIQPYLTPTRRNEGSLTSNIESVCYSKPRHINCQNILKHPTPSPPIPTCQKWRTDIYPPTKSKRLNSIDDDDQFADTA